MAQKLMLQLSVLQLSDSIHPMASFKLQFSLGFVTSCYVIMNISIAWTTDKPKIT